MNIQPFTIQSIDTFYPILKTSFPEEEFLPYEMHLKMFSQPTFYARKYNNFDCLVIGYQLPSYLFLELFMVKEELRNQGLGKTFLSQILKEAKTPVILEVELPTDDLTKRRIKFYERLGFHLNVCDYQMPRFDDTHGGVPFYLMSYPNKLTDKEIEFYKKDIHQAVYLVDTNVSTDTL